MYQNILNGPYAVTIFLLPEDCFACKSNHTKAKFANMLNGINDNSYHLHQFQSSETPFTIIMYFKQRDNERPDSRRNFAPKIPTSQRIPKNVRQKKGRATALSTCNLQQHTHHDTYQFREQHSLVFLDYPGIDHHRSLSMDSLSKTAGSLSRQQSADTQRRHRLR